MKKTKKARNIWVNGKQVTWLKQLHLCCLDLGLPPYQVKTAVVAAKAAQKYGIDVIGSHNIIHVAAAKIVEAGNVKIPPRRKEKFVYWGSRSNVVPIVPSMGAPHPDYKKDPDFYKTNAWRQLRYLALKNTDGRCSCCGASQKEGIVLHVDHVLPRYKRPDLSLSLDNLQVLCEDCNLGKGGWDDTDWRVKM